MKEFIDIIKGDKKSKMLFIITVGVLFICTVSYSLSIFSNNKEGKAANIIVNGLSFNMTTNTGETDDRILKLKANTLESFNVVLTNLNTMDVKYELIYEVCTDNSCTSTLDKLPDDVVFGIHQDSTGKITDTLIINGNTNIFIISNNSTNTDYYIKLNLNAGYSWNELSLINQIDTYHKDIYFIAYVDGVEQSNFPNSCDYTYTYKTYKNGVETTDSEVTLTCTNNTWNINVTNIPNKVKVWFTEKQGTNAVDYLVNLENTAAGKAYLRYDGMEDSTISSNGTGNLRYFGSGTNADDVPNYVSFNNELWRIIGVFKVYNADTKITEKALKIIRNESLGEYSWDTSASTINGGYGVNAWNDADLMYELNGDYLNPNLTSNPTWYNGSNNQKSSTFNRSYAITEEYQQFIMNARWYLGGWNTNSVSAAEMYRYEKNGTSFTKTKPGTTCNGDFCTDTVTRDDYVNNLIGLAYTSDFGLAAKDNGTSNCSDKIYFYGNCKSTYNWMSIGSWEWTITQQVASSDASRVFYWSSLGSSDDRDASSRIGIRPTLYLKHNILITGGDGTTSSPYRISL